ncbi:hypothetical protein AGRA3207_007518 [Actinomadura graeca]|uniref:PPM-type phosphatase domain-containing protein n=1 Tax=Actinomadura graeca TaxID=2750812 RepID=A0ABX8R4G6_9ACTN|nr:hypothetical protein [Actinomadura graeca]QXJ25949.1 hypothetical protein AGRA3207_007518 [Actinomadura graeca]
MSGRAASSSGFGVLLAAPARSSPRRSGNTLTRHIGRGEPEAAAPDPGWRRLLLCSDGLTRHLSDPDLRDLLTTHLDVQATADALVQAALQGGSDNIAVAVIGNQASADG